MRDGFRIGHRDGDILSELVFRREYPYYPERGASQGALQVIVNGSLLMSLPLEDAEKLGLWLIRTAGAE